MSALPATTSTSKKIIPSDVYGRALLGLIAMIVVKWISIAGEIGLKDAPNQFLIAFGIPLTLTFLIRERLPRTSGVIGVLFGLFYSVFECLFLNGDFSGWKWYEYMVTFVGVPVALLIVGLSARRVIKRK